MISINVTADIKKATAQLNEIAKRQIPFATSQALNSLAFSVQKAERFNIQSTLAHPRPFTANSVQVQKATKATQTATVFIRPEVAKYLEPFEVGGLHVLPGKGATLLNPKNVGLDQYGQLTKNKLNQLAARPDVFVGKVNGVSGFWQRLPVTKTVRSRTARVGQKVVHHLKLLIRFGDALPVTKRLGFGVLGAKVVAADFTAAFGAALIKALRTAK
ncbi:hypothetical protein [Rhodopila sp.]|uniref:hypothetical protein n=1 Tax=Rhodopila sp. TaxID=2480087 RepID=UPI003D0BDFF4